MPKSSRRNKDCKQSGGADSGWSYVMGQVGNGWTQFQNALTLQPGQNLATLNSNDIEPIGQPNFQNTQAMPSAQDLALIQSAGKRRKSRKRGSKGGNWGAVAQQAAAPLALLAMQQNYKKKRRGGNLGALANQAATPLALLAMQQSYKKKRRGGNLGALANQAATPLALLAMQQNYGKHKTRKSSKTRKNRKSRRR